MSAEAASTYYVVVDVPAGEWLTANGRLHWAQRARRTRALRVRAALAARAARILTDHRDQVDVLATALIERRALTGRQVHDLLQHRPEKK